MLTLPSCLLLHRTCPKTHPKFKQLVQRVTQNFDTFEDFGDCALENVHESKYNVKDTTCLVLFVSAVTDFCCVCFEQDVHVFQPTERPWINSMTTPTDAFVSQTFRLLNTTKLNKEERIMRLIVGDIHISQTHKNRNRR